MVDQYLEIPRLFTSIAESLACLIYIMPLKKRYTGFKHYLFLLLGPIVLTMVQLISGELPLIYWVPGMLTAMAVMYIYIWLVCDISKYDAGFLFIRAFILAEFAASLEWQIYYAILYVGVPHKIWLAGAIMVLVYSLVFTIGFWVDARKVFKDRKLGVTFKELLNALIIGIATFLMNNINFVMDNPFTDSNVRANLLYIRTLVDLSGLLILFASNEQRREMNLNHELNAINDILHKHYDQYQASKDNIEVINRKYHDFKHQINQIRNEQDPVLKEKYLDEIDHSIRVYESSYDTGNTVVDTILTGKGITCFENDITLSCVVNGKLLDFMYVMDICSVFGNAIDNCIESVKKIDDLQKRIIRVAVFSKNGFLMMRFENYFEEDIIFRDGLPVTTKSDMHYHGYGIKSIKKTIEGYNGNLSISTDNNWFVMKILIPLPSEE
ncbi:GHKL domain-containing protein [Fusibacter bizertensis]|uniref:GHKL domain-containing protein n=1 Tax=Fusibacter bizertensis TaxID=1488331 RepID=A0ABT6N9D1_9FIRM|nr:GHKL domain-containing protein [Fusibacter bizertensis]MDH8677018.1 GHKL domain-containing protein [Fusibacter bizertensis]